MTKLDEKICCGKDFLEILKREESTLENGKILSFVNPFSYEVLKKRKVLVDNIDYFFSDGALLCFFNNIFKKHKITRASFDYSSIANEVFEYASDNNLKVAIVGATEEELRIALQRFTLQYQLNVIYSRNGYFNSTAEKDLTYRQLAACEAELIIVGMGTPYQEDFSVGLKSYARKGAVILTCGGFLTQTSIRSDYYYPIVKKLGIRWLQRVLMHKHVRKRVLKEYPSFILNYLKDNLFTR